MTYSLNPYTNEIFVTRERGDGSQCCKTLFCLASGIVNLSRDNYGRGEVSLYSYGQSYKAPMIVMYVSRVINISYELVSTTLEL